MSKIDRAANRLGDRWIEAHLKSRRDNLPEAQVKNEQSKSRVPSKLYSLLMETRKKLRDAENGNGTIKVGGGLSFRRSREILNPDFNFARKEDYEAASADLAVLNEMVLSHRSLKAKTTATKENPNDDGCVVEITYKGLRLQATATNPKLEGTQRVADTQIIEVPTRRKPKKILLDEEQRVKKLMKVLATAGCTPTTK